MRFHAEISLAGAWEARKRSSSLHREHHSSARRRVFKQTYSLFASPMRLVLRYARSVMVTRSQRTLETHTVPSCNLQLMAGGAVRMYVAQLKSPIFILSFGETASRARPGCLSDAMTDFKWYCVICFITATAFHV